MPPQWAKLPTILKISAPHDARMPLNIKSVQLTVPRILYDNMAPNFSK